MQTAALRYQIGDDHTFEFVQGTIPWPMAPGGWYDPTFIVPNLTGPELSAISNSEDAHYAYFDPEHAPSYLTAFSMLDTFLAAEGPFDGVLAFSQGAGLATMYMARKKLERPDAEAPFRCAILCSPTAVGDPFHWFATGEMRRLEQLPRAVRIDTPTAMIWGSRDDYATHIPSLCNLFLGKVFWHYVFDGGHELPSLSVEESIGGSVKIARRAVTQATHGIIA